MAYQTLRADADGAVLTLTLDRPDHLNALTVEMGRELTDALKTAGRDAAVRAIVLTGSGRAFCAGQDLKALQALVADREKLELAELLRHNYNALILQMRRLEKPLIAAVNGVAADAGMSLALACDLRIAAADASFLQAFVNIGLVPDSGSLYFLPRIVGLAKALELCLLGEPVPADEALRFGLVSRVVPAEDLAEAAAELAARLASGAGVALGLTKRGLNRALDADLSEMLEYEALLQEVAGRTADFREGVTAFSQKRRPEFTGT